MPAESASAAEIAKALVARLIGEERFGELGYFCAPQGGDAWGGPFNGQERRQEIWVSLVAALGPTSIVETGTYRGTTTAFFAATGLPVFTIEAQARNYGYAKARLRHLENVHLIHGDSRAALVRLFSSGNILPEAGSPFVYLDAHWKDDLPLADELDVVFSFRPDALVMVDDFEVPGDAAYGFDNYGPGKVLTASYIQAVAQKRDLIAFYPRASGADETGAKRGCAILANRSLTGSKLLHEALLRPAL
jgi:predicted O-methyltransferase YrrM